MSSTLTACSGEDLLDEASRVRSSAALIRAEEKLFVAFGLAAVAVEAMIIAIAAQAMRLLKLKPAGR